MTDQTTQLLAAIRTAQQQHERFKVGFWQFALNNLASEIPAAIITQFESLKMTHSEMEILSQLTTFKTNLVPYKTLQAQVSFSQGMFSRYINRLAKTELITKTKQPDNKKKKCFLQSLKLVDMLLNYTRACISWNKNIMKPF